VNFAKAEEGLEGGGGGGGGVVDVLQVHSVWSWQKPLILQQPGSEWGGGGGYKSQESISLLLYSLKTQTHTREASAQCALRELYYVNCY